MIDVIRPGTAPASLAEGRRHDDRDVLEALHAAFLGKCYLCETPVVVGTFQVDHRHQQNDGGARFDWKNLFPICNQYRCNQRRQKRYPEAGLLSPGDGVESRIAQRLDREVETRFVFVAVAEEDRRAASTAEELDRLHNAKASTAKESAEALRLAIVGRAEEVDRLVEAYLMEPFGQERRAEAARALSRAAPYTMLMRSRWADHEAARALFD